MEQALKKILIISALFSACNSSEIIFSNTTGVRMLDKIGYRVLTLYPDSNYYELKILDWHSGDLFSTGNYRIEDDSLHLISENIVRVINTVEEERDSGSLDYIKVVIQNDEFKGRVSVDDNYLERKKCDSSKCYFVTSKGQLSGSGIIKFTKYSFPRASYMVYQESYTIRDTSSNVFNVWTNKTYKDRDTLILNHKFLFSKDSIDFYMPYEDTEGIILRKQKGRSKIKSK